MRQESRKPALAVLSSLFPSSAQPLAGVFIRERMFRIGQFLPVTVVSPAPWFPGQALLRRVRPHFRPEPAAHEVQQGIDVFHPRFFSPPGIMKWRDGSFMASGAKSRMLRLATQGRLDIIDAHFGFPDGFAAVRLAQTLKVPVTITLRGTEARHARDPALRPFLKEALQRASGIICVSNSLRDVALELGAAPAKLQVIGNGVDTEKFAPKDRGLCRAKLGLDQDGAVLISVGGLVERKGFHRVIEQLPALTRVKKLTFLIVGGPSAEGDMRAALEHQVRALNLSACVRFLGETPPERLGEILSAADVFVLATRNEGWANVLLEAMACGLPVVTTDVGGNREVVRERALGMTVPFGDGPALLEALKLALTTDWDRTTIRRYAEANSWDFRVKVLRDFFVRIYESHSSRSTRA